MLKIEIAGQVVFLDTVQMDSMEEPEESCTNSMCLTKIGEVTFQYAGVEAFEALQLLKKDVAIEIARGGISPTLPSAISFVLVKFHKGFTVNWQEINAQTRSAMVLGAIQAAQASEQAAELLARVGDKSS